MARTRQMVESLPDEVGDRLETLGANVRLARKRRGISVEALAGRMGVSPPTVRKLERGAPTVSLGTLVLALWALGLGAQVGDLAAPETDAVGLLADLRRLPKHAPRARRVQSDDF